MRIIWYDFICNDNWRMMRDWMWKAWREDYGEGIIVGGIVFVVGVLCIWVVWTQIFCDFNGIDGRRGL